MRTFYFIVGVAVVIAVLYFSKPSDKAIRNYFADHANKSLGIDGNFVVNSLDVMYFDNFYDIEDYTLFKTVYTMHGERKATAILGMIWFTDEGYNRGPGGRN